MSSHGRLNSNHPNIRKWRWQDGASASIVVGQLALRVGARILETIDSGICLGIQPIDGSFAIDSSPGEPKSDVRMLLSGEFQYGFHFQVIWSRAIVDANSAVRLRCLESTALVFNIFHSITGQR